MPILKTIVTTTAQILDPDGAAGFGNVKIRPNAPFEYFDGVSTIQVSDETTEISVQSGKLASTLELQPNTGATNNPETYYIVDIDVNGTENTIYWQIDSADPATIEFSDVTQLPSGNISSEPIVAHVQATNPHNQYALKSDTSDTAQTGTASDGRGYIPRLDPTSGQLPKGMYTGGTAGIEADDVPITDAGGYYTATEVEAALQEIGVDQAAQDVQIGLKAPIDSPNFTTTAQVAGNTVLTTASTGINAATLDGDLPDVNDTANTIVLRSAAGRSEFAKATADNQAVVFSQFTEGVTAGTAYQPFVVTATNDNLDMNWQYIDLGTIALGAGGYGTITIPGATITDYWIVGVATTRNDTLVTLGSAAPTPSVVVVKNLDTGAGHSPKVYLIVIGRAKV